MRRRLATIACLTLVLLLGQDAHAQRGKGMRSARNAANPRSRGLSGTAPGKGQAPLSTFRSSRFRGMTTRAENIRRRSPLFQGRSTSLLDEPMPSHLRTRRLLEARNLLSARSALAQNVTPYVGRSKLFDDNSGKSFLVLPGTSAPQQAAPTTQAGEPSPLTYEDVLENRLDNVARERFNLGAAYARSGDYLRAEQSFDIAKQIWADDPKPYLAGMYVAFKQRNTNTALSQMILALDRVKTLDDMNIDRFVETFYTGESPEEQQEAFRSTLEALNMTSVVGGDSPLNVLLAYFAWVDGDIDAAVQAAESANRAFGARHEETIGKFRDLLAAEKQARQSPSKERKEPAQGAVGDPTGS